MKNVRIVSSSPSCFAFLPVLLFALALVPGQALQAQGASSPPAADAQQAPDENAKRAADNATFTPAQNAEDAWSTLKINFEDKRHNDVRTQAIAALGILGGSPEAEQMIIKAMGDPDLDIRTAAILAAGQMRDRNLSNAIRGALDDKEPQVAFAAASTLFRIGDRSGEDILAAVVDGERSANPSLRAGAEHDINREMHNPAGLAKLAAMQGAYALLGPFGYGMMAWDYIKKNGGDSARVQAVELLAQEHTNPVRLELIAALKDRDVTVRAAAARALANYHEKDVAGPLSMLFTDPKLPVQLTSAAAYLKSTGAAGIPSKFVPLMVKPTDSSKP